MTSYTTSLIADFRNPQPITPRSFPLGFCLDAPWDDETGTYEVAAGDDLRVTVYIQLPENATDGGDYAIRALNVVSWRGARAADQVFNTMLRNNPDGPDEMILTAGSAQFLLQVDPPPLVGAQMDHPACLVVEAPFVAYDMTMPTRLILERPGLFAFLVSLTIEDPNGALVNFIIDPELDVGGTYPPD